MGNDPENFKTRQLINFLVEDCYRPLRHGLLLTGMFTMLFLSDFSHAYSGYHRYYSLLATYLVFIAMFYINIYLLVPRLFFRGYYLVYLGTLAGVVMTGLSSVSYILNVQLGPYRVLQDETSDFYEGTIVSICVILVTTTLKLMQRWVKDNERISELNNLTLRMELNELRNQINPHFLFNMLNNVKALIRINPEMATMVVMKLSEFLRFQLYEDNDENKLLISEVNFLSTYVNLEKIRRDNLDVIINSKLDSESSRITVPPNLFIMFVENAVKHSADISDKGSYIRICFEVVDEHLRFSCVNSVNPTYAASEKRKSGGLGLVNIRRRLELLYQKNYRLNINACEHEYSVDLAIPI